MPGEEYLLALGHLPADNEETSQAGPKTLFSVYLGGPWSLKRLRSTCITFQATEHQVGSFMKVHMYSVLHPPLDSVPYRKDLIASLSLFAYLYLVRTNIYTCFCLVSEYWVHTGIRVVRLHLGRTCKIGLRYPMDRTRIVSDKLMLVVRQSLECLVSPCSVAMHRYCTLRTMVAFSSKMTIVSAFSPSLCLHSVK